MPHDSTTHEKTLANLQTALAMELTAAHQYQLHAAVLDDWGLDRLANQMREEMQEELGHSNDYLERIIFLRGVPQLKFAQPPVAAGSLVEMFETDRKDESDAIAFYTAASQQAFADGDIGSRVLFERIVLDEEGHLGWLELQLSLIQRMGEPAYIAKHLSPPGEAPTP